MSLHCLILFLVLNNILFFSYIIDFLPIYFLEDILTAYMLGQLWIKLL